MKSVKGQETAGRFVTYQNQFDIYENLIVKKLFFYYT